MGKVERSLESFREILRRSGVEGTAGIAKMQKHGKYVRVKAKLDGTDLSELFKLAENVRKLAEEMKIHAATQIEIPGPPRYILHVPANYSRKREPLPIVGGRTYHHGPPSERPGKVVLAVPLSKNKDEGTQIFDDVGILREGPDGKLRVLTDFDILQAIPRRKGAKLVIGEVLTSKYGRINHKAVVWRDVLEQIEHVDDVKPFILVVGPGNELLARGTDEEIRRAMRATGFKNFGDIHVNKENYRTWGELVRRAAGLRFPDHTTILAPARQALVEGKTRELTLWNQLFGTLARVRKEINKGIKAQKTWAIQTEILRFPEYLQSAENVNDALERVIWGITQHLPPDAANGLKKKYPSTSIKYKSLHN